MNVERGGDNTVLVTARQVSGETHYLLVFTREDNQGVAKCIATNSAGTGGPLLLTFTETDNPTATAGEVELAAGQYQLVIYSQGSSTNLDVSGTLRNIWSELVTVTGDGGAVPDPEECPTFSELMAEEGASGTVDTMNELGITPQVEALICDATGGRSRRYVFAIGQR